MTRYRTIVADPPWRHERTGVTFRDPSSGEFESHGTPYAPMTVDAIKALLVKDLAEGDRWHVNGARGGCNLFLWATTRYLYDAHDVARAWKFVPQCVLVWCKPPRGFGMGGTFKNNVEFVGGVCTSRRGRLLLCDGSSWPVESLRGSSS